MIYAKTVGKLGRYIAYLTKLREKVAKTSRKSGRNKDLKIWGGWHK